MSLLRNSRKSGEDLTNIVQNELVFLKADLHDAICRIRLSLATLSTDDEDENEDKIMTQMLQRDWSESVTNFVFGAKNRI